MFRGGASRQTAYALGGPCSSPGSLCLGTKAVSGVRDYPRSTGCSDLKLLVSLRMGQAHMQIYVVAAREGRVRGGKMGTGAPERRQVSQSQSKTGVT